METIPGTWRGGEAGPGRGFDIPLVGRTSPRVLLLLSAIASSAVTDTPLPAMASQHGQVGRFPDPFRLPPELPDRPVAWEKGLLPLRDLLILPPAEEDEEGCSEMPAVVAAPKARCPSGPQKDSRLAMPCPATEPVFSGSGVDEALCG